VRSNFALYACLAIAATLQRVAHAEEPTVKLEPAATSRIEEMRESERDAFLEAPPPAPHRKGFVLDASAGALFFVGGMGKVATPGPQFRFIFGYEPFAWLLAFARAELAFSTTGNLEEPPFRRAFPIYGGGAGLRATVHITPRVAGFVEGSVGVIKCDIATNALLNLGLPEAERLRPDGLARLGIEWYQLDRHMALGLAGGVRLATGFARLGQSDTPTLAETQATVRYTF
jgi:hypothetical protein